MAPHDASDRFPNEPNNDDLPPGNGSNNPLPGKPESEDGTIGRRTFLRGTAAAAAAAAASGLISTVGAATTRHGIEFETVVDAVDDLGMDPTGSEPIDGALEDAYQDDTLIEFPAGEYAIDDGIVGRGVTNFGIRGLGDSHRDVTFTPQSPLLETWLNVRSGGPHLVENLSLNQTSDDERSVAILLRTSDGSVVKDVEWLGKTPEEGDENTSDRVGYLLTFDVGDESGVGLVEDVTIGVDEPAEKPPYPRGRPAIRQAQSSAHRGEAVFRRVTVHDQGSTALRCTENPGVATIESCEFLDNANANLRFGAGKHPSKTSVARDCSVTLTSDATEVGDAIRLHSNGAAGALVEDTTVVVESGAQVYRGAIAFPDWGEHGRTTFRNVVVSNNCDGLPTVYAEPVETDDDALIFENCSFTGSAENSRGTVFVDGRDGSTIRNSCIQTSGTDQDGVQIQGSAGCEISDTNINVDGEATVFENSTVDTSGITYDDTCRLPGGSGDSTTDDGSTGGGDSTSLPNDLQIQGTGTSANYSFEVTEELEPESDTLEEYDTVTDTGAEGWVTETTHTDEFTFSGEFASFEFLEGEADVYVNGELFDTDGAQVQDFKLLEIEGTGTSANYSFEVTGDFEPVSDTIEEYDTVTESGAEGWVTEPSHVDAFEFTGEVDPFEFLEGEADVYVDGELVDLTDSPTLATELEVRGTGASAEYDIAVSNRIAPVDDTVEDGDSVSDDGTTASGTVGGDGSDTYTYDGELTDVQFLDGEADVYVGGELINPDAVGLPNKLVVDGQNANDETTYQFSVSGDLESDPRLGALEDGDSLEGGSVSGSVADDIDGFRFSGDLRTFSVDGNAAVTFEDNDG